MKVYGQLSEAGYELVSVLPVTAFDGRIVLLNDGNIYTYFQGEWKLTGSLTQAIKTIPSLDPLDDAGDILGLDTDGLLNSGFIHETDKLPPQADPATVNFLLESDGTNANWVEFAGGGLVPVFIDETFAAVVEKGKNYVMGHSAAFNIQLPPAVNGNRIGFMNSSEAASWADFNVTILRDGTDTIDGDPTLVCDVDRVWVELYAEDGNWQTRDPFQPIASNSSSSGFGSGKNYVLNPDAITGINDTSVTGVMTRVATKDLAELPEESKGAGFKIIGGNITDYHEWLIRNSEIDSGDNQILFQNEIYIRTIAGYVDGDYDLIYYNKTTATELSTTPINVMNGRSAIGVLMTGGDEIVPRIIARAAGSAGLVCSSVTIDPGEKVISDTIITEWEPSGITTTNLVATSIITNKRQVGENLEITWSGTWSSSISTFFFNMPAGLTIDTAKTKTGTGGVPVGVAIASNVGVQYYSGSVVVQNSTTLFVLDTLTAAADFWRSAVPFAFGAGDTISIIASLPIVEFSETTNLITESVVHSNARLIGTDVVTVPLSLDPFNPTVIKYVDINNVSPGIIYNLATGAITFDFKGTVRISASILSVPPSNTGSTILGIGTDTSSQYLVQGISTNLTIATSPQINHIFEVDQLTVLYIKAWTSLALTDLTSLTTFNNLAIERIADVSAGDAFSFGLATELTPGIVFKPSGEVQVHTGNGHGSINNKIRRFTTAKTNVGLDVTYADSATLGGTFTINRAGIYNMGYTDLASGGGTNFGISINSNQVTINIALINVAHRLIYTSAPINSFQSCGGSARLSIGDIVRVHTDGATNSVGDGVQFNIVRTS